MGAQLFFKHLFNSINKRKSQPLLLVCVIAVAVAVCISTVNLQTFTLKNVAAQNDALYGKSDYVLSVDTLFSRFVSVDEAQERFGDRADICGTFDLPMFYGDNGNFLYGVATDFEDINAIFDIYFRESLPIERTQLSFCAFISRKTADKYGLRLGDEICVSIFADVFTYTVFGIADNKFLDTYDVMVDISSIVRRLSGSSALYRVLFSDADIADKLYFKVKAQDSHFLSDLKDYYGDMSIGTVALKKSTADGLDGIILLMILAIVFFVLCVVYCCCSVLATQRIEETYLFYCVGAKSYMLNAVSVCELALYWLVGSVFGVLLSYPVGQQIIDVCGFGYCTNSLSLSGVLFSVFVLFFATEGSLFLFIFTDRISKKQRRKKKKFVRNRKTVSLFVILLWVAVFSVFAVAPFVKNKILWKIAIADYLCFILALTLTAKYVCSQLPKIFLRKKGQKPFVRFAFRNIERTGTLSNLTGLIAIMVTVLFSLSLVFAGYSINMNRYKKLINGDYMTVSATESSIRALRDNEKIESVESILKENILRPDDDVDRMDVYSATDAKVFQSLFTLDELPQKNEAYIFGMLAKSMGIKIGDTFTIEIGGKEILLLYAKELKVNTKGIVINAEYHGLPYNYTVIQGKEGVSDEELYKEITSTLALDGIAVLKVDEINRLFLESNIYGYYSCLTMLIIVVLFSAVGIENHIVSSYKSRREQFSCYAFAGMSKKEILNMKAVELAVSVGCGVVLAVLTAPIAFYIIYQYDLTQGINLWWLLFVKP